MAAYLDHKHNPFQLKVVSRVFVYLIFFLFYIFSCFIQPYEFKVGGPPGKERKREFVDNPNGLFSAQAAPKPPPAMYSVTEGMKVGGKVKTSSKFLMALYAQSMLHIRIHMPIVLLFRHHFLISLQRTVIVPPEAGYDKKRMNEIPVKP